MVTVNSDPFGPNSPQIEAGKPGNLTKPFSEMDQGIVGPLVHMRRRHSCWPLESVNEGIATDCRTGTSNVAQGLDYLGTVKTAIAIILVLSCYLCMGKVSHSNPEKNAPPPLLMARQSFDYSIHGICDRVLHFVAGQVDGIHRELAILHFLGGVNHGTWSQGPDTTQDTR
jgi:hypothetical protein